MSTLKFADTHNMVTFLSKPTKILVYCHGQNYQWEVQLHALVDSKEIVITESSVRRDLQLEDEEGVDCLPNSIIFEQLALMRQDSGNITKTRSKATLNEPSFSGTSSGSGPRRQETMGDTIAQTWLENLSKLSNDPLLAKKVTLQVRVKKLEKKDRSRTHKLKRLYKVGLSARVESSGDEEDLGEDASKHGRIADIDAHTGITLVSTHFDVDTNITATLNDVDITMAKAPGRVKSANPRLKKVLKRLEQMRLDEELAFKLQAEEEEEEERHAREKAQQIEEANIDWDDVLSKVEEMIIKQRGPPHPTKNQKVDDVQETAKVDNDQEAAKIKELMEIVHDKEEVEIDAIPLATKPPTFVGLEDHKEGKKTYYQIIRADGSSKMYLVFSHMLKSFDREDLETLWKLVKASHGSTRPEEGYEKVLWGDLSYICGVHSLRMQHVYIHMLVEKRYPLKPSTITDMLNKKLQLSMKKLEILKKNIKFRGGLLGLKDFLMILELLLLSYYCSKIKTAERVSTVRERIKTEERIKIVWRSRLLT
ncbi:hypothetical protein Tco_0339333 [Tanacetum coccineum]